MNIFTNNIQNNIRDYQKRDQYVYEPMNFELVINFFQSIIENFYK